MAEPTEHTQARLDRHAVQDKLDLLDAILAEVRSNVGDPAALGVIVQNLSTLVEEGLPDLAGTDTEPDAKAQMLRLRAQIAELEQLLHTHQSILAGFSIYLKELVEG
ncbi:hypothetical protein [Roseicyclus sp.]|uniref:hypothetical protein n=1 Tax=Roseicyclus sp. TaxID=1914329 RepID=UPI003F6CD552